ncbi:MAG TPA: hypothetical protein VFQ77_16420 [Pseudonocardiaceae bacterium]|nr:hypothetical protein [Pseudonocardiaceae bacterium]
MATEGEPWKLEKFSERLDSWIALCSPSSELRRIVRTWVLTRYDDPYQGMEQQSGFPNLWFGRVPNSGDGRGNAVACSYRIEESTRTVICNDFTTLSEPF